MNKFPPVNIEDRIEVSDGDLRSLLVSLLEELNLEVYRHPYDGKLFVNQINNDEY